MHRLDGVWVHPYLGNKEDMTTLHWATFVELIATPFEQMELVWEIVLLYFGLLLNETTAAKANFRTAIQTGFSFLWVGAQCFIPVSSRGAGRTWSWRPCSQSMCWSRSRCWGWVWWR